MEKKLLMGTHYRRRTQKFVEGEAKMIFYKFYGTVAEKTISLEINILRTRLGDLLATFSKP